MLSEEELQSNVSVASSSPTSNCISKGGGLKVHNYFGLSDSSSVESSTLSCGEDDKGTISLKATELTLGLPGSQSPVYTEKNWMFPEAVANQSVVKKEVTTNIPKGQLSTTNNSSSPPAAKAQIVGWPPVRSYRKNTLATTCKNSDEVDGKPGSAALFVKVSMDGAPYLRKVDLRSYGNYGELSSALEKMFTTFTLGQCGSNGAAGKDMLRETKLKDFLNGKDYVLTYEDKDGDWMLVGDVPWEMFIDVCKKLKIMKGADAIGLAAAPRAMEKSKMRA
ncbi:auxin-responsive protein IAA9 isoform X3 [Brassica rapa]|uniref:auxin-responsive protein IAA9 isoform X3 n=1 Tax=Brassica campestris TaxID=3711 RepID=UPI00142DC0D5|nr:auxin-responsive protein IAA9 isoform X3 [Brassica rapa]